MLTHVVFFKLHERTPERSEALRALLMSMEGRIPTLRALEVGVNVVPSDRAYDVALIARFDSLADLQAYQQHAYHVEQILPSVRAWSQSMAAVDYST